MVLSRCILGLMLLLCWFEYFGGGVDAQTVHPQQLEVLYRLRAEMPALATLPENAWTNDAIVNVCRDFGAYGIVACNGTGWVTNLFFDNRARTNKLGTMAPSLGDMEALESFSANGQAFSGLFEPSIGRLKNLKTIWLETLIEFYFPIPPEWEDLKSLESFHIDAINSRTSSPLPSFIADATTAVWPNLKKFQISFSGLNGTIPPNLATAFPSLTHLDLSGNQFELPLPAFLSTSTSIQFLSLEWNNFAVGSIISDWSQATGIKELRLRNTKISGNLPSNLPPNIEFFDAGLNIFSGSVPQSYADLLHLHTLKLESNRLTGPIPWPTNPQMSKLKFWDLSDNTNLRGVISDAIWLMPHFETFFFPNTKITGPFPNTVQPGCALRTISAGQAPIGGPLPSRIDYCVNLTTIFLGETRLNGTLPPTLGKLKYLTHLYLPGNAISGPLFSDWSSLSYLEAIWLQGNQLNGTVPRTLVDLGKIGSLWTFNLNGASNHLNVCGDPHIFTIPKNVACSVPLPATRTPDDCGCLKTWEKCFDPSVLPLPSDCDSYVPSLPPWYIPPGNNMPTATASPESSAPPQRPSHPNFTAILAICVLLAALVF